MAEEVLRSLYRIVVPLPGSPLKEINSYVITAPDRNLVIDTGMNRPECLAAMEAGLAEIGIDLDSTDFLATHLHADHHGLIPTLLRPGRRAFMGAIDAGHMRHGMGWTDRQPDGPLHDAQRVSAGRPDRLVPEPSRLQVQARPRGPLRAALRRATWSRSASTACA